MTITLNHTIVPARDKRAAARFFARIFGLHVDPKGGHFAPVRINDTLTLLFDDNEEFECHHYAFHVGDAEFDGIRPHSRGEARLWERTVEPRQRVSSMTGTVAAASIFATLTAICSNL
jgi:catechol 2,3-dioxygenase-like lactoylglutathione lyase family enzyme